MAFIPSAELVTVAWLKGVTGLLSGQVATSLPTLNDDFAESGFVVASAVGGVPDQDTFMQNSTVQVDCYAYNKNSGRLPWGKANQLAMLIKEGLKAAPRTVSVTGHNDARVFQVIVLTDPRRVLADPSFARYSMDVRVHWVPLEGA